MASQKQTDRLYMSIAQRVANESYCKRNRVGCVIYTPSMATVLGYNGTPPGEPNICELPDGTTDPRVRHAEWNAIDKAKRHHIDLAGSTCYVTLQPCLDCARLLIQSGVTRVVYAEQYRLDDGVKALVGAGVVVERFNE